MSRDLISNFLTVIRNGLMVSKSSVVFPYSNLCFKVAEVLQKEGFIRDIIVESKEEHKNKKYPCKMIKILLKYVDRESVIHSIKRESKPGRRVYVKSENMKTVIGGLGISILTTSKGVMSDKIAKNLNLGGEVICTVW